MSELHTGCWLARRLSALVAAGLVTGMLAVGCDSGRPASPNPSGGGGTASSTRRAPLPTGLVVAWAGTGAAGGGTVLEVLDVTTGATRGKATIPAIDVGRYLAEESFSADRTLIAWVDDTCVLHVVRWSGDRYTDGGTWHPDQDITGKTCYDTPVFHDGRIFLHKARDSGVAGPIVSVDQNTPGSAAREESPDAAFVDQAGRAADWQSFTIEGKKERLAASSAALVGANLTVYGKDGAGDYWCWQPVNDHTLLCRSKEDSADSQVHGSVALLTCDRAAGTCAYRQVAPPGEQPVDQILPSPDRRHAVARTESGWFDVDLVAEQRPVQVLKELPTTKDVVAVAWL